MDSQESVKPTDMAIAGVAKELVAAEAIGVKGFFTVVCTRPAPGYEERYEHLRDTIAEYEALAQKPRSEGGGITLADGFALGLMREELALIPQVEQWRDTIHNLMTTVGKNLTLDTILAGSGFTATVVMGLKGAGSAAAGDTQASHAGWTERGGANAPTYTGNRPTPSFSAASGGSKATSAAVSFAITSSGNVDGCFINVNGSATKDNTTGTLLTAGDFTGGAKTVANLDTLNVTYSLALT